MCIPWGTTRTLPQSCCLSLHSFHSLISNSLKGFHAQELHRFLLGFSKNYSTQPWILDCNDIVFGVLFQFSSVVQSCLTLCDPMNRSTPGLPVHHQLPEFTQTQVHQVCDAIQPSHPLLSPSSPAPNPSQHQGLFQ